MREQPLPGKTRLTYPVKLGKVPLGGENEETMSKRADWYYHRRG